MPTETKTKMLGLVRGFKLVAVAGPDVGLYRKGDEFALFTDEGGLGEIAEVPEGRSYPESPSGKRWRWLFGNAGAGERIAKRANGRVVSLANGDGALD